MSEPFMYNGFDQVVCFWIGSGNELILEACHLFMLVVCLLLVFTICATLCPFTDVLSLSSLYHTQYCHAVYRPPQFENRRNSPEDRHQQ